MVLQWGLLPEPTVRETRPPPFGKATDVGDQQSQADASYRLLVQERRWPTAPSRCSWDGPGSVPTNLQTQKQRQGNPF